MSILHLRLPTPNQDFETRKNGIFWGTCASEEQPRVDPSALQQIQEKIILQNFKAGQDSFLILGPVKVMEKPSYGHWKVLKATLGILYEGKALWKVSAQIVAIIATAALSAVATYSAVRHLTHRYQQMNQALLYFYRATDLQHQFPIGKYGKSHFAIECIGITLGLLISYAIPTVLSFLLMQKLDSFQSIFQQLSQMDHDRYAVVQVLNTVSSTHYSMPPLELIQTIFSKNLKKGRLSHPTLERTLTENEQKEMLEYLCSCLCISEEDFLGCWKVMLRVDSTREMLYERTQQGQQVELHNAQSFNERLIIIRLARLIKLMPTAESRQRLACALLQKHREQIAALAQNKNSQDYLEIFGDNAFSVDQFLVDTSSLN